MTHGIMIPTGDQLPAHLRGAAADTNTEFTSGVSSGPVLPFLSIRGKEFRLRWQGQERNLKTRELDVVFVASRANISKRWYASQYSSGSIDAPDCSSTHGAKPDPGVGSPQHDSCASCPKNQFGSRITPNGKQGKACSDFKRLIMLPLVNGQPIDTPVVVDVPAMSLKSPKGYQGQDMFLREYFSILQKHGLPVTGVVTTLGFTDAEFPQLHFRYKQPTDEALYNKVLELRQSDEVKDTLEAEFAENPGPISEVPQPTPVPVQQVEATPTPQPAPQPVPQTTAVHEVSVEGAAMPADVMGSVEAFLQQGTPAPSAQPDPQPRAEEQQPAQETAPAPQTPPPAAAGGDLLAEVGKLLGDL